MQRQLYREKFWLFARQLIVLSAMLPKVAMGVEFIPDGPPIAIPDSTISTITDFYTAICAVTQWFLVFGLIIGVLFVIWGGIKYVTSHGDSTSESDAKKIIRNAMIGVAFLILAVALVRIVASFFGATGFSLSSASCSL